MQRTIFASMRPLVTIAGLLLITNCTTTLSSQGSPAGPDRDEFLSLRLSMDLIERGAAASLELKRMFQSDPAMRTQWMGSFDPWTHTSEMAQKVETNCPEGAAVVQKHGLTVRQFIDLKMGLLLDVYMVMLKQDENANGAKGEILPNPVLPENAALIEHNTDRIRELVGQLDLGENW